MKSANTDYGADVLKSFLHLFVCTDGTFIHNKGTSFKDHCHIVHETAMKPESSPGLRS